MHITVTTEDGRVASLEVADDETVENVKALVEVELGIAGASQQLIHNGAVALPNASTLQAAGVKDQDMLLVREQGLESLPLNNPAAMVQMLRGNPALLQKLRETNADLAAACEAGDVARVRAVLLQVQLANGAAQKAAETLEQARLAAADPFDMEAQARIAENIQRENVNANMEQAMEHMSSQTRRREAG